MGFAVYLKLLNQSGAIVKGAIFMGNFICAECVCSISQDNELRGVAACVVSPVRARRYACTLVGRFE